MKTAILLGLGTGVAWLSLGVVAGWLLHCKEFPHGRRW
jgi:hypothetical protein